MVIVGTKVHLSIGGMSEAYLVETLPNEDVTGQESKNLKSTLEAVNRFSRSFCSSYNQTLK